MNVKAISVLITAFLMTALEGCLLIEGGKKDELPSEIKQVERTPLIEHEAKPEVAPDLVDKFIAVVRKNDAEQLVITEIQPYKDSPLLYLTVADEWSTLNRVEQSDIAIALRNEWKTTCDCFAPQLVFRTTAGTELIHITAGQPKFKN